MSCLKNPSEAFPAPKIFKSWMAKKTSVFGINCGTFGIYISRCDKQMDPTIVSFVKHERLLILHKQKKCAGLGFACEKCLEKV